MKAKVRIWDFILSLSEAFREPLEKLLEKLKKERYTNRLIFSKPSLAKVSKRE